MIIDLTRKQMHNNGSSFSQGSKYFRNHNFRIRLFQSGIVGRRGTKSLSRALAQITDLKSHQSYEFVNPSEFILLEIISIPRNSSKNTSKINIGAERDSIKGSKFSSTVIFVNPDNPQ